jgi:transposase
MRRSSDGLQALTRHELGQDPLDGSLYVFVNRRATQMRVLYFDRSGFCVWLKRLESGRFSSDWSQACTREMDWTGLKLLLEGIGPGRLRKRYRYVTDSKKALLRFALRQAVQGARFIAARRCQLCSLPPDIIEFPTQRH